jgi:hypothetical protein
MMTTTEYLVYRVAEQLTAANGSAYVRCVPVGLVTGAGPTARVRRRNARAGASLTYAIEADQLYVVPAATVRSYRRDYERFLPLALIRRSAEAG